MGTLDGHPVDMEVAKSGVGDARWMVRNKAFKAARVAYLLSTTEQCQARAGQRIGMAFRGVKQERYPWVEGDVAAVLRKIGQQQQRARVNIDGKEYERSIRGTVEAGSERRTAAAARQQPTACPCFVVR